MKEVEVYLSNNPKPIVLTSPGDITFRTNSEGVIINIYECLPDEINLIGCINKDHFVMYIVKKS